MKYAASLFVCATTFLTLASPAGAQTVSLSAVLLGGNECNGAVPPNGPVCRRGDPDAFGRATVTFPTPTTICVTLQVDNLAGVTAAHIHQGRETVNGPVVFAIVPPPNAPAGGNPGATSFCAPIAAALQTNMRNNPANFYVNVHNAAFSTGAMRGQLF
jgi:hypothetical protein